MRGTIERHRFDSRCARSNNCGNVVGGGEHCGGGGMQGYDIIEEMYSPKSAAANFVHELCSTRPKGNLEALMQQARHMHRA